PGRSAPMVVRAGALAMRVTPWPADPATAQITAIGFEPRPTADSLRRVVRELAAAGYGAAVTGELGAAERRAYVDAGFEPRAWLYLLDRRLDSLPDRTSAPTTLRRILRTEWPAVAEVDGRAFPLFWRLGVEGIGDARR